MFARSKITVWLIGAALGWAIVIGTSYALSAAARFVWGALS